MNVIAYLRVSTSEQAISGLGLEAQEIAIKNYISKIDYKTLSIYKDEGMSGSLPISKRKALQKAISCLKMGDILIVAKRDRLSRDVRILMLIEDEIKRKKARILSAAGEGTESDDAASIIFRGMIDQFAQFEKLRIGERTKAALHAKKLQGKRVGHIPFGFKLADNQQVIPNELEQEILNKMKELRNKGLSIRKIAKYLNEHNLLNRNNAKFNHASVHRILMGSITNKHNVYYHN